MAEGGAIPDDQELADDLTGIEYSFNARDEILLEKKEHMKARGLASPDDGDGLALTFAVPVLPTSKTTRRRAFGDDGRSILGVLRMAGAREAKARSSRRYPRE
jgi:hypothetical protein